MNGNMQSHKQLQRQPAMRSHHTPRVPLLLSFAAPLFGSAGHQVMPLRHKHPSSYTPSLQQEDRQNEWGPKASNMVVLQMPMSCADLCMLCPSSGHMLWVTGA